ncbi:WXG100 family type VII secretion target [Nocardia huaxiensis]|uniref:WXG100 family type VII secretion target n=1 Tax=Nocardia huaxiensis TaxID=2755382 RepID=A0A7D7A0B6_9NOCA|nr:WXG100 family type VII secretion target [Nocardia huaxiensis]QLY32849.1 WXG100 family type VII secretion target [Nocardia huaxiensis]UFS93395.1 WXG100 family type VII secretion target [Nocardia huaxiensis]
MGTKFSVANNAVTAHATNLDSTVAALNGQASRFLASVESLPSVWKGASFDSWDRLSTTWHQAMNDLNTALEQIRAGIGQAGSLYTSGEVDQAGALDSAYQSFAWDAAKFRG